MGFSLRMRIWGRLLTVVKDKEFLMEIQLAEVFIFYFYK